MIAVIANGPLAILVIVTLPNLGLPAIWQFRSDQIIDPWLGIEPRSHVLVLFLHPLDCGIAVLVQFIENQIVRKWGYLLDSGNRNPILKATTFAFLYEFIVDLAALGELTISNRPSRQ